MEQVSASIDKLMGHNGRRKEPQRFLSLFSNVLLFVSVSVGVIKLVHAHIFSQVLSRSKYTYVNK